MSMAADAFAFAGNAFLSPDAAHLEELAAELGSASYLSALQAAPEALEQEYNRLFFNPAGTPCPLWQSAQGAEPQLMGESHLSALEWYRQYGVEPALGNDPADHIGLLLLFYARLLEEGIDEGPRSAFAQSHLAWVPAFCGRLEAEARHLFYRTLASETRMLTEAALAR
jgi:TorA maturation chaperone TorD